MKIGVISDIHGHARELEGAIELLVDRKVDKILCAGDVVEKGYDDEECVRIMRDALIPCVRGNHDDNLIAIAEEYGEDVVEPFVREYLEGLPRSLAYEYDGKRIILAHGIPGSNRTYFFEDRAPKRFKKWARDRHTDFVILGHTHQYMAVQYKDMVVLNPGSVSCSRTRDTYTCGVLDLAEETFDVLSLIDGALEVRYTWSDDEVLKTSA